MVENPRTGRQAKNFTTNVPKIPAKSQIVFRTVIFRKLTLGAPVRRQPSAFHVEFHVQYIKYVSVKHFVDARLTTKSNAC